MGPHLQNHRLGLRDPCPGNRASCPSVRRRPTACLRVRLVCSPVPWVWLASLSAPLEHGEMDPLSDVLRAVRLDGAFFYFVEARHPWSVEAVPAVELVPRVLPEAEHLISYHILVEGQCWGGLSGEAQVCLQPGDVIVFPHGDPHVMSSAAGQRVDPGPMNTAPDRYLETVRIGAESGAQASFVCGFLGCDLRPYNPLLAGLPRLLHVPAVTAGWLSEFPRQVVSESQRPSAGGVTVLTRMAELLFVEVLRRHVEADTMQPTEGPCQSLTPLPCIVRLDCHPRLPQSRCGLDDW